MEIKNLSITKCRVIEKLDITTFLVEDLLDNKEKELRSSGKQAMNYRLQIEDIVYACYSIYVLDKSKLLFLTGTNFKRPNMWYGHTNLSEHKDILDDYLPIKAKYA